MATHSCLLSIAVVFVAVVVAAKADLEAHCRAVAESKEYPVQFAFCTSTLRADPGSETADARGIAAIAVNLASKGTKFASEDTEKLAKSAGGAQKAALESCGGIYTVLYSQFGTIANALSLELYKDAAYYLVDARRQPALCDDGFKGTQDGSPLARQNVYLTQMTTIALAIATTLG